MASSSATLSSSFGRCFGGYALETLEDRSFGLTNAQLLHASQRVSAIADASRFATEIMVEIDKLWRTR